MPTNAQIIAFTSDEKSSIRYLAQLGIIQPLRCRRDHTDENGNPRPMKLEKKSENRYRAVCHPCVYAGYGSDAQAAIRKDNWLEGSKLSSCFQEARRRRNGNRVVDNESYLAEGLWRMKVDAAGRDPFEAIVADIIAYWPPGTPAGTTAFYDNPMRQYNV